MHPSRPRPAHQRLLRVASQQRHCPHCSRCSRCSHQIKSLVLSPDPHERLAGVLAIDELAQTKVGACSGWGAGQGGAGTGRLLHGCCSVQAAAGCIYRLGMRQTRPLLGLPLPLPLRAATAVRNVASPLVPLPSLPQVFCQSAARLSDLVKVLMEAFQATTEVHTMHAAAATLGRLVKAGGPLMADVVEEQVGCLPLGSSSSLCLCMPARCSTGHATTVRGTCARL